MSTKTCPVCNREVDASAALSKKLDVYYFGRFYYLRSRGCKSEFLRDPGRYIRSVVGRPL